MQIIRGSMRVLKRLLHISRSYAGLADDHVRLGQRAWLLEQQLGHLRDQVDLLKSSIEVSADDRLALNGRRALSPRRARPLVSVCIATFNRAPLLIERSLASVLDQTYENLEINVVGDGCTDDTERLVRGLRDPRVRFVNLPSRGAYPTDPERRWMVAGTAALNHALSMCTGDFVTHLDDDDAHTADRIEKLLLFALSHDCDFVWHPFLYEDARGNWQLNEAPALALGCVTTSAIFYRSWLKDVRWDVDAHWLMEPGDWNRVRRMKFLGINAMRYPEALLRHFREQNQASKVSQKAA